MENIIEIAIILLNDFRDSISVNSTESIKHTILSRINDYLNELLEKDLSNDEYARLFCQRLNKFIQNMPDDDDNSEVQYKIWLHIQEDLPYVLYGSTVKKNEQQWNRFVARIQLESKLEQRKLQCDTNCGQKKSFSKLLSTHRKIIDEYLRKCILLHSKVQVRDLIGRIDDLLYFTENTEARLLLTDEKREQLENKLKCIEISLDCWDIFVSLRSLGLYRSGSDPYATFNKDIKTEAKDFLPTVKMHSLLLESANDSDMSILQHDQGNVVLGEQKSGKTTLMRLITRNYAKEVLSTRAENQFYIPILIRLKEFAEWHENNSTLALIDYIGKHTWFSQVYHSDDIGNVLKEFIYQGHALILLDGLDEIPTLPQRYKIVKLIRTFIEDYVHDQNFLSVFDDPLIDDEDVLEIYMTLEENDIYFSEESVRNRIIITSSFVGYDLYSFNSPNIKHRKLVKLEYDSMVKFASEWVIKVEQSLRTIFLEENIPVNAISERTLMNRLDTIMSLVCDSDGDQMSLHIVTLFCMHIFNSWRGYSHKTATEIYDYAVQATLRTWTRLEPTLSKDVLLEFCITLACNIYLQSPTNLIDEFDLKQICFFILRQFNIPNNHRTLQEYANRIIQLFNSDLSFLTAHGLEVYSFIHFSFQRYFVIQALLKGSSIADIVTKLFKFSNRPRLYYSLLLTISWISSKWPLEKYNEFCSELISRDKDYALPLGSLLFFDGLTYIHNLPSKSIIFQALNNLLDHPSDLINQTYLSSSMLPTELILEWMKEHINSEKRVIKFCYCLLRQEFLGYTLYKESRYDNVPTTVFQKLWSLRHISIISELAICQTLRCIMQSNNGPDHIFDDQILQRNLSTKSNLPLIFPINTILALCDGSYFLAKQRNMAMRHLSSEAIYRLSSTIEPLRDYFLNTEQSHLELVEQYEENILTRFSPDDTSSDLIDTFIAFICLCGIADPSIYAKFSHYKALRLVLTKFKEIYLDLSEAHQFYTTEVTSDMESIANEFFTQSSNHSIDNEQIRFLFACIHAGRQVHIPYLTSFASFTNFDLIKTNPIRQTFDVQFEYRHYLQPNNIETTEYIPFDLLALIPQSRQTLLYDLVIETEILPLSVLLSECLIYLDKQNYDDCEKDKKRILSLITPLCKANLLENYVSTLSNVRVLHNWNSLIDEERQLMNLAQSNENQNDLQLFTSCLCLARLGQAHYRHCRKSSHSSKNAYLASQENHEIDCGIKMIKDPILQLILLNMILRLKEPLIFSPEYIEQLNQQIIVSLNKLFPNLSLSLSTYLFVQNYERLRSFPYFIRLIGEKFLENSDNEQHQRSAYIALRSLNDKNLSSYLSTYETEHAKDLPDILLFYSTVFHECLLRRSSTQSGVTLLSLMYLIELSRDIQILDMYVKQETSKQSSSREQLDLLRAEQIMTADIAQWITDYLKLQDRELINEIIEHCLTCYDVKDEACTIINQWFEYRTDQQLKFFAYYAALFCSKHESIEILKQMFTTDDYLRLKSVIQTRLELKTISSSLLTNVIIPIIENAFKITLQTSARIQSQQILDALLQIERERIQLNKKSESSLLTVRSYSQNLDSYLIKHIQDFKEEQEYIIEIIRWIILESIDYENKKNLSKEIYNCLMTLLHDKEIPRVQLFIINSINKTFFNVPSIPDHTLIKKDIKRQLEILLSELKCDRNDILPGCLLAYAKYLSLKFKSTIPSEIQDLITQISRESPSDLACIRAIFCFIISNNNNQEETITVQWLQDEFNLSTDKLYMLLVESDLYRYSPGTDALIREATEYIYANSAIFLRRLIEDTYNNMCNVDKQIRLLETIADSGEMCWAILRKNRKMFLKVLRETEFGEAKFKSKLCEWGKKHVNQRCLLFYMEFGDITYEFVETFVYIGEKDKPILPGLEYHSAKENFGNIKTVSGRNVIEYLFKEFRSKFLSKSTFSIRILEYLIYFSQHGFLSPIELYEQLSFLTDDNLYQFHKNTFTGDNDPFHCLMECRRHVALGRCSKSTAEFLTIQQIEEKSKKFSKKKFKM